MNNNNNNNKGKCMFIDTAISGDRNVIKKVAQKVMNYEELTIEIQHVNNVKTEVTAVTIGTNGTILQSFSKDLKKGKHEIKDLHHTATLGTAHIFRKVLI
jgi:hypothetical protein